jgi:hypothetical protein
MSAQDAERMVRSLPDAELRRFAEWWEAHRAALLEGIGAPETEAVKTELQRRRQEYRDHPERFQPMNDASLDQMFRDIENEKP